MKVALVIYLFACEAEKKNKSTQKIFKKKLQDYKYAEYLWGKKY